MEIHTKVKSPRKVAAHCMPFAVHQELVKQIIYQLCKEVEYLVHILALDGLKTNPRFDLRWV